MLPAVSDGSFMPRQRAVLQVGALRGPRRRAPELILFAPAGRALTRTAYVERADSLKYEHLCCHEIDDHHDLGLPVEPRRGEVARDLGGQLVDARGDAGLGDEDAVDVGTHPWHCNASHGAGERRPGARGASGV